MQRFCERIVFGGKNCFYKNCIEFSVITKWDSKSEGNSCQNALEQNLFT